MRRQLGGGKIDFTFWWVALGYDTVKIIEHAVKTAGSIDPAKFKDVLENTTDLPRRLRDLQLEPERTTTASRTRTSS